MTKESKFVNQHKTGVLFNVDVKKSERSPDYTGTLYAVGQTLSKGKYDCKVVLKVIPSGRKILNVTLGNGPLSGDLRKPIGGNPNFPDNGGGAFLEQDDCSFKGIIQVLADLEEGEYFLSLWKNITTQGDQLLKLNIGGKKTGVKQSVAKEIKHVPATETKDDDISF